MITLSDGKLGALTGIYESAGLQVVLDVMEASCIEAENELIGESPENPARILALHAVAHSQRKFFQQTVQTIDYKVAEHRKTDKKDNYAARK